MYDIQRQDCAVRRRAAAALLRAYRCIESRAFLSEARVAACTLLDMIDREVVAAEVLGSSSRMLRALDTLAGQEAAQQLVSTCKEVP